MKGENDDKRIWRRLSHQPKSIHGLVHGPHYICSRGLPYLASVEGEAIVNAWYPSVREFPKYIQNTNVKWKESYKKTRVIFNTFYLNNILNTEPKIINEEYIGKIGDKGDGILYSELGSSAINFSCSIMDWNLSIFNWYISKAINSLINVTIFL